MLPTHKNLFSVHLTLPKPAQEHLEALSVYLSENAKDAHPLGIPSLDTHSSVQPHLRAYPVDTIIHTAMRDLMKGADIHVSFRGGMPEGWAGSALPEATFSGFNKAFRRVFLGYAQHFFTTAQQMRDKVDGRYPQSKLDALDKDINEALDADRDYFQVMREDHARARGLTPDPTKLAPGDTVKGKAFMIKAARYLQQLSVLCRNIADAMDKQPEAEVSTPAAPN